MDPVVTPVVAASAIRSVRELTGSIEDIRERTKPFKPEIKSAKVDYLGRSVEMVWVVHVPQGIKRTFRSIELPSKGLRFSEVRTSLWDVIPNVIVTEGDKISFKAGQLPDSDDHFLVLVKGQLSPDALRHWVSVASSADPLDDNGCDIYWITAAIQDPELLEELYRSVQIDNVDISIHVALQRYFLTSLPPSVHRLLQAQDEIVKAAQTKNRNLRARAEHTIRHYSKSGVLSQTQIAKLVAELVSQTTLRKHVRTTDLYQVLRVDADERRTSLVPERFAVHAGTYLSRARKIADGKLFFARDEYKDSVAEQVKTLLDLRDDEDDESATPGHGEAKKPQPD
jgi:hypothetical protein